VILPLLLSFFDPWPTILVAHGFPYAPDYARDIAVIRFDARGDFFLRNKVASE
jgi:hypothetical protein